MLNNWPPNYESFWCLIFDQRKTKVGNTVSFLLLGVFLGVMYSSSSMCFLEQVPFACSKLSSSSLQQICLLKQRHSVTRNGIFAATNEYRHFLVFDKIKRRRNVLLTNIWNSIRWFLSFFHLIAHLLLHPHEINLRSV